MLGSAPLAAARISDQRSTGVSGGRQGAWHTCASSITVASKEAFQSCWGKALSVARMSRAVNKSVAAVVAAVVAAAAAPYHTHHAPPVQPHRSASD